MRMVVAQTHTHTSLAIAYTFHSIPSIAEHCIEIVIQMCNIIHDRQSVDITRQRMKQRERETEKDHK